MGGRLQANGMGQIKSTFYLIGMTVCQKVVGVERSRIPELSTKT
jgi:hypothetical protein